jgi:hypothetical protein
MQRKPPEWLRIIFEGRARTPLRASAASGVAALPIVRLPQRNSLALTARATAATPTNPFPPCGSLLAPAAPDLE